MEIAVAAIADQTDSRASAALWHGCRLSHFLGPPAIRLSIRTRALVPLRVSLHGEIRFLPRASARVPPNFTAPAPCVRSPSGRRSGYAHPALPFG